MMVPRVQMAHPKMSLSMLRLLESRQEVEILQVLQAWYQTDLKHILLILS